MLRTAAALLLAVSAVLAGACSGSADGPGPAPAGTPRNPATGVGAGAGATADAASGAPTASPPPKETPVTPPAPSPDTPPARTELATFAGGCYWCVEAVFEQVPGVIDAVSGFMGGHAKSPTYEEVCAGGTGHAEVVQVRFDPAKVTYEALLDWFWRCHDPTTLDRQGADVGDQYRSAIFFHDDAQRRAAEASMKAAQRDFDDPIVTQIAAASELIPAPKKHQDFYGANREYGYCRAVIRPKLKKLGLKE